MSVRERILDAGVLYAQGRREGALLSILVAVAATARKRYPRSRYRDEEAFTQFVHDEMPVITGITSNFRLKFREEMIPFQDLLYRYMRCQLIHEGSLPEDVRFEQCDSLKVNVTDKCITFSDGLIQRLAKTVLQAPENKDESLRRYWPG